MSTRASLLSAAWNAPTSHVVNWAARIYSVASIGMLALMALSGETTPTGGEWLGLMFFPMGIVIGMIWSWWRPLHGAILTLACLAAFYAWSWFTFGLMPGGPYFLIFASPALLFAAAGSMKRIESV